MRGGKREGAGRKPALDKKVKLQLYIKASIVAKIKKAGNKEASELIEALYSNTDLMSTVQHLADT